MLNDVFEAEKAVHLSADFGGSTHTRIVDVMSAQKVSELRYLASEGERAGFLTAPLIFLVKGAQKVTDDGLSLSGSASS